MGTPRIVFVMSPYQNAFFSEIAEALGTAIAENGVDTLTITEAGDHVVADDDVFVLLPPHEYLALEGDGYTQDAAVARRTIGISAEQPHQTFFERNAEIGSRLGAVLDFSTTAVDAYRALGVDAGHLQFGYVPAWDRVRNRSAERHIETPVLYLGNKRPRRLAMLAEAADVLARQRARLVVSDNSEPNRVSDAAFFTGERKRDLLAGTGVLINIHQSDEPYFEWLRFADAAHCGTPVLSERSVATAPFDDGEHFVSFEQHGLGAALTALVSDGSRRDEVAHAAYERLVQFPLRNSVDAVIDTAQRLLHEPAPDRLPARTRTTPIGRLRNDVEPSSTWTAPNGPVARVRRRVADRWTVVAPPGTSLSVEPSELTEQGGSALITTVMAHGHDAEGAAMLEGLWPWQPWRLQHGEHLGRVMVVDRELARAAFGWLDDRGFDEHTHLGIQLFAAVHGVHGSHIATPFARLAVPVDPTHVVGDDLADRCRQLLGQPG